MAAVDPKRARRDTRPSCLHRALTTWEVELQPMVEAQPTERGSTVTLKGMEIFRAAGMLSDQVQEVVSDLLGEVEAGLRSGMITTAIERLSDLEGWLEALEYGAAGGRVEIPLDVLFTPSPPGES